MKKYFLALVFIPILSLNTVAADETDVKEKKYDPILSLNTVEIDEKEKKYDWLRLVGAGAVARVAIDTSTCNVSVGVGTVVLTGIVGILGTVGTGYTLYKGYRYYYGEEKK